MVDDGLKTKLRGSHAIRNALGVVKRVTQVGSSPAELRHRDLNAMSSRDNDGLLVLPLFVECATSGYIYRNP